MIGVRIRIFGNSNKSRRKEEEVICLLPGKA